MHIRFMLFAALLLFIAACQSKPATPAPTATPVPAATLAPTAAPLPTVTPVPPPAPLPLPSESGGAGTAGMPWWNDRVFYEVFVRSFQDSDGDGIGDLQGLISRLDYLNDGNPATTTDLGVSGLWLMPINESPSYHGYDVVDYEAIESDYGTVEDLRQLLDEAHKRGMVVIVDMVMNHSSSQHPWFQASIDQDPQYADWYLWEDEPPFRSGPWGQSVWHPEGDRYYYGLFWEEMPDLNFTNPEVTEAIYDVIRFWLSDVKVDGFRLDAIKHLIEEGAVQENTPSTHAWLEEFHKYYKSVAPAALTVGEAWTATDEAAKYVGDEADIIFEFDLAQGMIDAARSSARGPAAIAQAITQRFLPAGQYGAFLANHDQNRVMTQLSGDAGAAKVAATMLLTNPGVPFLYYGEEVGMTGQKPDERIRTPMHWTGAEHAGFTTGQPWQSLASGFETANVENQTDDPDSLLSHYRALIHLRAQHPALRVGELIPVKSEPSSVYAYLRHTEDETLLVLINLSEDPISGYRLNLAQGPLTGQPQPALLFGEGEVTSPALNASGGFDAYVPLPELPPHSSFVIRLSP